MNSWKLTFPDTCILRALLVTVSLMRPKIDELITAVGLSNEGLFRTVALIKAQIETHPLADFKLLRKRYRKLALEANVSIKIDAFVQRRPSLRCFSGRHSI